MKAIIAIVAVGFGLSLAAQANDDHAAKPTTPAGTVEGTTPPADAETPAADAAKHAKKKKQAHH